MYSFKKYNNNPIYGNEKLGTCFDVLVQKIDNKYRMDFSWRSKSSTAVCFSDDGLVWSDPVITLGPDISTGWEDRVNRNCVVYIDGKYKMWYTGQNDHYSFIGYAESEDGIHFKKYSSEPIIRPEYPYEGFSVMNPCVLFEEGKYKMWYSSGETYEPNVICYAESEDGIHFKKHITNPILSKKDHNFFEKDRLGGCQVLHTEDMGYVIFYIGYENIDTARICVAHSVNGKTMWERSNLNPIVGPDADLWDGDATYKPSAIWIPDQNEWRVYYNGRLRDNEYIGLATYKERNLFKK